MIWHLTCSDADEHKSSGAAVMPWFGASDWCCTAIDCEESHFQMLSIKVLLLLLVLLMDSNQPGIMWFWQFRTRSYRSITWHETWMCHLCFHLLRQWHWWAKEVQLVLIFLDWKIFVSEINLWCGQRRPCWFTFLKQIGFTESVSSLFQGEQRRFTFLGDPTLPFMCSETGA